MSKPRPSFTIDRASGAILLAVSISMCAGATAVILFGQGPGVRIFGSVGLGMPAAGMLWIAVDLNTGFAATKLVDRAKGAMRKILKRN